MIWKYGLRPILFTLPPESAHYLSMGLFHCFGFSPIIRLMRRQFTVADPRLKINCCGLEFQNPVGLAAGFDKDARWFQQLPAFGFSHIEVGTLTGQPQPGNARPRLFRLPADGAIINRMGFNNGGSNQAARRLSTMRKSDPRDVLGINIGKTKTVPLAESTADYLFSFERLFDCADYFTVNVSSPNTPGLRELQNRKQLLELLQAVSQLNQRLAADHQVNPKPILLKIAPDLTDEQLSDIVSILQTVKLAGVIATNTTLSRSDLKTPAKRVESIGAGGLSGQPLTQRSRQVVATLYRQLNGQIPIVGVGGIMNGEDAWQMILAGASLVQVYTGFIYGGPSFVRQINRHILQKMKEHGFSDISAAVGTGLS